MSPRRISRFRENLWELREFLHKWDLECAFLYFIQLRVSRVKQWRSPFSWVPTACCCFYMSMLRSMLILFFHFIVIFFSSIFYFDFKETTKTSMHIISCLLFPSSSRTFIITTLKFNTSVFPTAIPSHIISLKKLKWTIIFAIGTSSSLNTISYLPSLLTLTTANRTKRFLATQKISVIDVADTRS